MIASLTRTGSRSQTAGSLTVDVNILMKFIWFNLILLNSIAFGDAPLRYPDMIEIWEPQSNYCALIEKKTTTIYKRGCLNGKEIYKIKGFHPVSYLRENGSVFISTYPGLNLVGLHSPLETVIVEVFDNGEKKQTVKLKELIKSFNSLQKTSSHYQWGSIKSLNGTILEIVTKEGEILFNYKTGIISK